MPSPGIYLINSTGETTPLATGTALGTAAFAEALDTLDLSTSEITPIEAEDTDTAEFDAKAACFVFGALEWCATLSVGRNDMEVAAEYANALFLLSDQRPAFWGLFIDESEQFVQEHSETHDHQVGKSMHHIAEWAQENGHPVAEWFERAGMGVSADGA